MSSFIFRFFGNNNRLNISNRISKWIYHFMSLIGAIRIMRLLKKIKNIFMLHTRNRKEWSAITPFGVEEIYFFQLLTRERVDFCAVDNSSEYLHGIV